jgi:hypothetical protein
MLSVHTQMGFVGWEGTLARPGGKLRIRVGGGAHTLAFPAFLSTPPHLLWIHNPVKCIAAFSLCHMGRGIKLCKILVLG